MKEFSRLWKALTFAFIKHGNQKRKSLDIPYVIHPVRILLILRAAGFSEFKHEDLMISALLHDLIEDTDTKFEDIENNFGKKVARIVNELTKPNTGTKLDYLKSFRDASLEAKIIKMADRIDNLLDIPIEIWNREKQRSYENQAKIILETCGNANNNLAAKLKEFIKKF